MTLLRVAPPAPSGSRPSPHPRRTLPRGRARVWFAALVTFAVAGATMNAKEEHWLRVAAPQFTVLTPLPEKEALAWTAEFSQFVSALQGVFHVDFSRRPRLTIVIF